jgi:hypothetical protein
VVKSDNSLQTKQMLGLFLSFIAILVLGSLYADAHRNVALLEQDVAQLKASQVLLMVPDDHAANIANWLTQHPEQTQAIITSAAKAQAPSVWFGPEALVDEQDAQTHKLSREVKGQAVVVSENAQGVKVIRLSNGGIRVTTRSDTHP